MNRLFRIFLAAFFVTSIVGCTTAPRIPLKKQDVRTAITLEWRARTLCVSGLQVRTCFAEEKVAVQ